MDVKELMRTYIYLNDPRVKQVTIKFTALLIAIGAVAAVAYATFWRTSGDEALALQSLERLCMPQDQLAAWEQEHPDAEIVSTESGANGEVCITYREPAG